MCPSIKALEWTRFRSKGSLHAKGEKKNTVWNDFSQQTNRRRRRRTNKQTDRQTDKHRYIFGQLTPRPVKGADSVSVPRAKGRTPNRTKTKAGHLRSCGVAPGHLF